MTKIEKERRALVRWMKAQGVKSFQAGDISVTFHDEPQAKAEATTPIKVTAAKPRSVAKSPEQLAREQRQAEEAILFHSSG